MKNTLETRRLGATIRMQRKSLGLSQIEVCELADVGAAFLYGLEHGKPTVRLDKLLDVLAVLGLGLELRAQRVALSTDKHLERPAR